MEITTAVLTKVTFSYLKALNQARWTAKHLDILNRNIQNFLMVRNDKSYRMTIALNKYYLASKINKRIHSLNEGFKKVM